MSNDNPHLFDKDQTENLITTMLGLGFSKWHKQLEADPRLHDAYSDEKRGLAVLIRKQGENSFRVETDLEILKQIIAEVPNFTKDS